MCRSRGGERLFQRCQRVLAEVEELHADAAGTRVEPIGTLRLDLPIVYGREVVMPILAVLVQRHPRLELDVRLSDGFVDLVRDSIDVAIRVGPMRDSNLVARRIDRMVMLLCASPGYLAEHGTPRHVEDLAAHAAIVFRQPTSGRTRAWRLRQRGQSVESHPVARVRVNDGEGMIAAARMGLGLAQLPDHMVAGALARGELVEVLPSCRPEAVPISAVYPSGRMVPARVRVLVDALRDIARRPRPA